MGYSKNPRPSCHRCDQRVPSPLRPSVCQSGTFRSEERYRISLMQPVGVPLPFRLPLRLSRFSAGFHITCNSCGDIFAIPETATTMTTATREREGKRKREWVKKKSGRRRRRDRSRTQWDYYHLIHPLARSEPKPEVEGERGTEWRRTAAQGGLIPSLP